MHPSPDELGSTRSLGDDPASERDPHGAIAPGTMVYRYAILERIGRGGMGEVFLAHDPKLDRRLALKLIRDHARDERCAAIDRDRLHREAQALARLSHPNVVAVYDVGEWEGRTFIAMELVDGIHVGRWLRAQPRTLFEILPVFLAAGQGLVAAHAAGIIHRDFKPANVMVGRDGRICVLDFGLATDPGRPSGVIELDAPRLGPPSVPGRGQTETGGSDLTETGRTVGTPPYMAPEQHHGHALDARSDQFAFCVSLFEAVAGRRPFPGRDVSCLLRAKEAHQLLPLPEPSPMPAWLLAIIHRGLAPSREDRFATMEALLVAIERAGRRSTVSRRRRWIAAAGLTGVLGLAGAWWTMRDGPACLAGSKRVAEQWNPAQASAIEQAFHGTGLSYADATFVRVRDQLDAYARTWESSHRRACEANQAHGGAAEAAFDLRMQCLELRLDRLGATVEVLLDADAETVRRATAIITALPIIGDCDEAAEAEGGPAPPSSPAVAQRVEALRRRLSTASVLEAAGRYRDGLLLGRAVLEDAAALDYPPVQIEAHHLVGVLLMADGDHAAAEAELMEAALAAQALRYDAQGVPAMIDLVMLLGEYLARPDEARTWAEHARAALQRSPDPRAEARLWTTEAAVDLAQGNDEAAEEHSLRALELLQRTLGDDHPDLVSSHNNLATALRKLGRFDDAKQHYTRALALAEAAHGEGHPLVATLQVNLGGLLAERGKLAEARPVLQHALEIRRRALGPRHPEVGTVLNNLGGVTWELGDHAEARAMIREALEIQEESLGRDDVRHVPLLNNLAEMLAEERPDEARQHAERALSLLERFREPTHPRLIITLTILGRLALRTGDVVGARARLERALVLVEPLGPDHPLAAGPKALREDIEAREGEAQALTP